MSGFSSVIGFMLAFFVIVCVFFGIFYTYEFQIIEQARIASDFEEKSFDKIATDFDFKAPFYSSGRLNFMLENNGKGDLTYKKDNQICFSFYDNGKFISSSDYFVNVLKSLSGNYRIIEKEDFGIVTLNLGKSPDFDTENRYKVISCSGISDEYLIESGHKNWFSSNWSSRNSYLVENGGALDYVNHDYEIILNSSNFDFNLNTQNSIKFVLPLYENFVLDLTFDNYNQNLDEFSKEANSAFLGFNSGSELNDPTLSDGILFNGLEFNGKEDYVRIDADTSLELKKSLTYSAWLKWNGEGESNQSVFVNGHNANSLLILNDGGVHDNEIVFKLNVSGTVQELYSNVPIDTDWHFVAGTYNGTSMQLYLDGASVSDLDVSGDISAVSFSNYVGSNGLDSFFNGTIDEVKILNLALSIDEISDLFYNNLRFRELEYNVNLWDAQNKNASIDVVVPFVRAFGNASFDMYFN